MRASTSAYPTLSPGTKSPSHLVLRNGTWHFRMAVPMPCRPRLGGLSEFKTSLRTGVLREAKLLAGRLAANAHLVYLQAQKDSSQLEKQDKQAIRALAKAWLLNGLDCHKAEHQLWGSSISAETQMACKVGAENKSECCQHLLSSDEKSSIASEICVKDSSGQQLHRFCDVFDKEVFFNKHSVVDEKLSNVQVSDKFFYDVVRQHIAEIIYGEMQLNGGGLLDYQEIRSQLAQWLACLLEEPNKQPISQKEIRERLNGYLRGLLEKDDVNICPRQGVSGPGIELTASQTSYCNAGMLNDPESVGM